jgi:hypothetical protein
MAARKSTPSTLGSSQSTYMSAYDKVVEEKIADFEKRFAKIESDVAEIAAAVTKHTTKCCSEDKKSGGDVSDVSVRLEALIKFLSKSQKLPL